MLQAARQYIHEDTGKVNLMVKDVPWQQVLDIVLKNHSLTKEVEGMSCASFQPLPFKPNRRKGPPSPTHA
jgi:hypothetical protein